MFKNMRIVILFDMLLNPSFKMTTRFANIELEFATEEELQFAQVNLYTRKDFKSIGIESLYEK